MTKYIVALVFVAGMILGMYWMAQPRPSACGSAVLVTDQCPETVNLTTTSLKVTPSDYQTPNHNPQKTADGAMLWDKEEREY